MRSSSVFLTLSLSLVGASYSQTNFPLGATFGAPGSDSAIYPFTGTNSAGTFHSMEFSSYNGGLLLYSPDESLSRGAIDGGLTLYGNPVDIVLASDTAGDYGRGVFNVWKGDKWISGLSTDKPLFSIASPAMTAKFDGLNVEVNNGTLKVGGHSVLTAGQTALAIGSGSTSSANSFAFGNTVTAPGVYSGGFGYGTTAQGYSQFVVGHFNTLQGTSTPNLNWSDALFIVGNGINGSSRSNAFMVERSGNARVTGSLMTGPNSMATGNRSVATGESSAAGHYSNALGNSGTHVNATYSTSMGNSTTYGPYSTAMGNSAAGGDYSTAMGKSQANAYYGTAMGIGTVSQAYASTVVGTYNFAGTPHHTQWVATDDIFVVGNGVDASNRSNALVVKKNGSLAAGSGTVFGTVPAGSSQVIVGAYNDTSTEATTPATDRGKGVFTVGAGTGTSARKNALRVTTSGKVLVQPSGELSMGTFTSGEKP
ncbi:hypothetical protein OKA04_09890 [Luteolibacter flavescens]|uniref:Trimeric autotransporter adhesin YadA-like head domain-containing protein n=1 Tax=Luteolibacter flavescens TaxID=1859460 RepID=A0ABT3FNK2_9BACT|nr:hypothetical protein [Luteolibacter flavescens]MCW1885037.1 hypothetical protein [Luteolibacter flavescens]